MGLMDSSEKTKRFWAFLVSFVYPVIVLVLTFRHGHQILEMGFSKGQRALLIASLLGLPALALIYQNFKQARLLQKEAAHDNRQAVIQLKDECLSFGLVILLLGLPGLFFRLVNN